MTEPDLSHDYFETLKASMNRKRWIVFTYSLIVMLPPFWAFVYYLSMNNFKMIGSSLIFFLLGTLSATTLKRILGLRTDLFMPVNKEGLQAFSQLFSEYRSNQTVNAFVRAIDEEDRLPTNAELKQLQAYCDFADAQLNAVTEEIEHAGHSTTENV